MNSTASLTGLNFSGPATSLASERMKTFSQALCQSVGCTPDEYLRVALKHCLYPRPRCCHRLFVPFLPAADLQLLTDAGAATSVKQFNELLNDYRCDFRVRSGFLQRRLKLRISTTRLEQLFKRLMRGETGLPEDKDEPRSGSPAGETK